MKIAIACEHPSPASPVARRFGRAPHFLIYDTCAKTFTTLPNPEGRTRVLEAGIRAARLVRRAHIGVVIAGEYGDSALRVLRDARICLTRAAGTTVARATADFQHGLLADA